jgi:hypothetical protein
MIALTSLWLPILLSAVLVFIVSSIIHMLLGYHANDYGPLPDEEAARAVLRVPPGEYMIPHATGMAALKDPDYVRRTTEGPVALITIGPSGEWNMPRTLGLWFVYCVVVSIFAAYITGRALGPGESYLAVFRFASATAFFAYAVALWQGVIWYHRSVTTTLKNTFDGLIYALVTGGVFGWLWPTIG